ncbi:DUF427 domain-containing protein [Streptomyces sp. KR80]|uniref:DUF427 domain-containing protein n=1 Tax=Streptomyces sp. KR80 TaxID=3457426 RepID=UPI003FD54E33
MPAQHTVEAVPGTEVVTVTIDGQVVAESSRPVLMYETGLPVRYYLPPEDVAMHLLEPTDTHTFCPYKGRASYWSYRGGDGRVVTDVAWAYPDPLPEVALIKGRLSFYDTWADVIVERPVDRT